MEYLIGLDIGTSAVKGALMSTDGAVVTTASAPFTYTIDGGAKLLDPDHFTNTCFSVIRSLSEAADGRVAALCSCCAAGDPIFLDADMKPLSPIVGWQTQIPRGDLDAVYTKEEQDETYRRVGWPFLNSFPAAVLAQVKIHKPELLERSAMLVMHAEYLNHKITGKWGMSRSMGTPSYLMDQESGVYSRFMLDKFSLDEKKLPPIYEKGTVLGTVLPDMSGKLGLGPDCAVILGSFDHPSGALGAGVLEERQLLLSCGTSWVELFPVSSRAHAISTGGLVDRFSLHGPEWCVMKSLESVSDKIDRLREHFFGKVPHKVFDDLAGEGAPGCHGLRFDFTEDDLGRAKGFDERDVARAVIESAARLLGDNLEDLEGYGLFADSVTAIGGITNSKIATDIISRVIDRPLSVVNGQSAGAVGSCLLAGMGLGIYKDEHDAFDTMMRSRK